MTQAEQDTSSVGGEGFFEDIKIFNDMYKITGPEAPTFIPGRLEAFHSILSEELNEYNDLQEALDDAEFPLNQKLAHIADWLGDLIIYCASEMNRWGLDPAAVLQIIMQSNFSKLGADGKPIYDERGKVMKGPSYWKPEPKLEEYITNAQAVATGRIKS